MENEFYKEYKERVIPALQKQHGYKNIHQVPKVDKVVINTSVGSQSDVKQALDDAKMELALITGQHAAETRSKKSISNFKLRKDQAIGAKVTLRGERMYEFLERLIKAALPRIRDFRGVPPRGFDGHGPFCYFPARSSVCCLRTAQQRARLRTHLIPAGSITP